MSTRVEGKLFRIRRAGGLPWWTAIAAVGSIWASLLLRAASRGYAPPHGWTTALIATPVICLFFWFMLWLGNKMARQYVAVAPKGLLVAVPFPRFIRYDQIDCVKCVSFAKPLGTYWLRTFARRTLIPAWDEPPNVEVRFRQPVRLNLYPFRWFRLLQLTLDAPDEFVALLGGTVAVDEREAPGMFRRVRGSSSTEKIIVVAAIGLFAAVLVLSVVYP